MAVAREKRTWPYGMVLRPLKALHRWWRERQATLALSALDDACLNDIGVCRCEILRIARDLTADGRLPRQITRHYTIEPHHRHFANGPRRS